MSSLASIRIKIKKLEKAIESLKKEFEEAMVNLSKK